MCKQHVRYWELASLLSAPKEIEDRCAAIEKLSKDWRAFPTMRFDWRDERVICTQEWIADARSVHRGGDELDWMLLAEALDAKDCMDLVHGDLCVRNVIWSEERGSCLAVDWEPDLIQAVGGHRIIKVTKGYTHPNDLHTSRPFSLLSDHYAFARCLEQVREVKILSDHVEPLQGSYADLVRAAFKI